MCFNNFNIYRRNTSLAQIIQDGWLRGLHPEQTIQEASAAGYSMVIVRPMIDREWMRLNDEYEAFMTNHIRRTFLCTQPLLPISAGSSTACSFL